MGKDFNYSGVTGGNGNYTIDEIDRARKMQKKGGGTLLENLAKLTGRGMSPDFPKAAYALPRSWLRSLFVFFQPQIWHSPAAGPACT